MKKKFIVWVISACLPLAMHAQFELKGRVVEQDGRLPLAGAHIQLSTTPMKQVADLQGMFRFNNVPAGTHLLRISYVGFEMKEVSVLIANNREIEIALVSQSYLRDEVVVSATRVEPKSPLTYSIVTGEQLRKENTGVDLPYLLQSTPSIVVSSDAGTGIGYTGLRIRGTDLTRINVTLNGVPVNDAESHSVYFVDLPDLASSVESIQIQRGVGTSTNGAAAFGASINIQTSSRSTEAFGALSSSIGSFNTFKNSINFGTGISKKGFALDGRMSKISSDGFIDRSASNLKSFYLSGSWSNKNTLMKIIATSGLEKTDQAWNGIPKDSLKTNRTYNPAGEMLDGTGKIAGYYDNQTDNYQQDYYQAHIAHQINSRMLFSSALFLTHGEGYYESWKNNQKLSKYGLPNVVIGNITIKRTDLIQQKWLNNDFYGFHTALAYSSQKTNATLGGGWNRYDGKHYGLIIWSRFGSHITKNARWYNNTGQKTDYHLFAKMNYQLNERLNIFSDLQLRNIKYGIEGNHDNLAPLDQTHQFVFFNPKAGIYFDLSSKQSLYASIAVSNREPNRTVYRDADPNQEIKAEQLVNFEAGYKVNNKSMRFESNVYFMDYNNQLVLTGKINNVGSAIMTNVAESYRLGWENSLWVKLSTNIELEGNFSLSSNKILNFTEYIDNWNYWDDPQNQPYQYANNIGKTDISFSPSVTSGASINWKISKIVAFTYQSAFVGRQFIDNTSHIDRSLDPYFVNNVRLNIELPQKRFQKASFQLALNNIFNHQYETNAWVYRYVSDGTPGLMDGYFPQAGIHFMAQLNLGF